MPGFLSGVYVNFLNKKETEIKDSKNLNNNRNHKINHIMQNV